MLAVPLWCLRSLRITDDRVVMGIVLNVQGMTAAACAQLVLMTEVWSPR